MTDALLALATRTPRLLLALDYDGTLVPFAAHADDAVPDRELRELLESLVARTDTRVRIVSGRPAESLERFLGDVGAELSAEHGLRWKAPGEPWRALREVDTRWLDEVRPAFDVAARVPGSYLEPKRAGLAWHYRPCDPRDAENGLQALRSALGPLLAKWGLELLQQDRLVEVRVAGIDKGLALRDERAPHPDETLVAIGDDRTDEDLFAAAPDDALTIRVGDGPSRARHRLPDVTSVRRLLAALAARPPTRP